jgi:two-component system sensor histidine kinase PhcS
MSSETPEQDKGNKNPELPGPKNENGLEFYQPDLVHDEKLKALGTMYAGLAHELNNPLNFAVIGIELLKNEGRTMMSDEFDSTLADIENGLQRISNLVKDLRMLARKDQTIDLSESFLIGDVVTTSIRITAERTKNFEIIPTLETPYRVYGSASGIVQVLVNLINNAVDSINEKRKSKNSGGRINIYGKSQKGRYHVDVVDNGIGLSKNEMKVLFTPFHTSKPAGRGTGLGMTISQSIISQHGGEIRIDSLLGQWAAFTFDLELNQEDQYHTLPSP